MTYVTHCMRAFRHVWKDTIGELDELIDSAIKPFFLLHTSDELGMLNGAPDDGVDDRQICRRVEVN
jgi:hypothetical protein